MNLITKLANSVATASGNNPIMAAIVVFLMWFGMNFVFFVIEKVYWGKAFQHPLDIVLALSAWAVYVVVVVQIGERRKK